MKKRALLLLFFSLTILEQSGLNTKAYEKDTKNGISQERLVVKNTKLSKKDIKKDIKKRKKYHKSLLELYNKGFEEKYLKLISDNSIKIKNLKIKLNS